ncbi:hypothetical protein JW711_02530 [Candidatus Woesearchaeota archaeon]|nr:hypothetical protein [Candidatus Woesearchaeota archaeon]
MAFFLFLSFIDLLIGVMMLLAHFDVGVSWRLAIGGSFFLIGKSILFRGSFLSVLDFIAGIYLLLVMIGLKTPLVFLFFGLMIYKFIVSLLMRG